MKIQYVKNPTWADAEKTIIDLTLKLDGMNEEIPFTANPNDIEEHGRLLFAAAIAGEFGPIADFVPPESYPGPTPPSGEIPVVEA